MLPFIAITFVLRMYSIYIRTNNLGHPYIDRTTVPSDMDLDTPNRILPVYHCNYLVKGIWFTSLMP